MSNCQSSVASYHYTEKEKKIFSNSAPISLVCHSASAVEAKGKREKGAPLDAVMVSLRLPRLVPLHCSHAYAFPTLDSFACSSSGSPTSTICASLRTSLRKNKANFKFLGRRNQAHNFRGSKCQVCCSLGVSHVHVELSLVDAVILDHPLYGQKVANSLSSTVGTSQATTGLVQELMLMDLDPASAKVAISILGPVLSAFAFLFILRIVMSWYPKLPVGKFPYVIAYAPTEPLLVPTRKLIPPLGGVDVTPVVWFGLLSFLNEILLGPQGLLVLLSQQAR